MNNEIYNNNKSTKSKTSTRKMILVGLVAIPVICCCGIILARILWVNISRDNATVIATDLEQEPTSVEQTAIDILKVTEVKIPTNTPMPTDLPLPTDTSLPTNTPTLASFPTDAPLPTNTPTIPSTVISLESGGLGLFTAEWEQNHQRTELDWGIGTGYDNVYDVLFQQDKVWIIYRNFEIPATLDDIDLISTQLIPFDSEYIETYTPEGRPETTVIVYRSDFLTTRFNADFWNYAEPGIFIVQYKTYEGFGIGDMIISLDNNP